MDMLLFKIVVLWIAVDTVLIATGWFFATTVKSLWPSWWRRAVVDEAPPLAEL